MRGSARRFEWEVQQAGMSRSVVRPKKYLWENRVVRVLQGKRERKVERGHMECARSRGGDERDE